MVGIDEAFSNLAQATLEERVSLTNLTGTNINLKNQVTEYANNMDTKDSVMATTQKTIIQPQGEIKTPKSKMVGHPTKRPDATIHNKGN